MGSFCGEDAGKTAVRARYLTLRSMTGKSGRADADARILESLLAFEPFVQAPLVLTYVSHGEEVDTHDVIEAALAAGKRVAVPRTQTEPNALLFSEIASIDELEPGYRDILEPPAGTPVVDPLEMAGSVCLVPGLVFDQNGHRLGYGGGFYDAFLAFYPGYKLGLARSWQVSGNPLPAEAHDVPLDAVVSEYGAFWCQRQL